MTETRQTATEAAARPRSMDELKAVFGRLCSQEGFKRGLAFQPGATDIIVAPYVKCGTTWMQQIVHGLRSGGSMEFGEILEVVPWIELAHDMSLDLEAPQPFAPRAFKTHLPWDMVPKGGRYIVVFRDPLEAVASMHRFLEGWLFEPGSIPLAEYAAAVLAQGPGWWGHAASWWRQRDRADVLLLTFGGMKADLPGAVDRVADFIDPEIGPEAREIAARQASFDFMKRHERQFDDHLLRARRDAACGVPAGGTATKVAAGGRGPGTAELPEALRAAFEARWQETLGAEFGFGSYAEFARAVEARSVPAPA
ncbi:sulfotransferase domain-containing protein [Poseidonocella sp. HB161398]|uniref:sulfotransferase domain-containing protein n=1 Tax=Poseidonocella sp. HB161398 TaxID=2320855 RepID=UPI0011080969|nr:sulfotransferase domain-containing protein [Poseidonocella sp. HB161398]